MGQQLRLTGTAERQTLDYIYPFTRHEGIHSHLELWQDIHHPAPSPGEKGEQIIANKRGVRAQGATAQGACDTCSLIQGMIWPRGLASVLFTFQNGTEDPCSNCRKLFAIRHRTTLALAAVSVVGCLQTQCWLSSSITHAHVCMHTESRGYDDICVGQKCLFPQGRQ